MRVTIKDIAKEAGVSFQVVSSVLSGRGNSKASEKTRNKIKKIADKLGYQSNVAAQQLRGVPSKTIGIIVPPFSHSLPADMMMLLSSKLLEKGYMPFLSIVNDQKSRDDIVNELIARRVDGIIQTHIHTEQEQIQPKNIPIVTYSRLPGSDIDSDLQEGGYMATRHLLEHGHQRIGIIANKLPPEEPRHLGWKKALEEDGLNPKVGWKIELTKNLRFREQLDTSIKKKGVTAFFCYNDYNAAKLIRFLQKYGYRIPEDIAVIGYDGAGFYDITNPALTTVISPMDELSDRAVELILYKIENRIFTPLPQPPIKPRLHIGGSCGCGVIENDTICWDINYNSLEMNLNNTSPCPEKLKGIDPRFNKNYSK